MSWNVQQFFQFFSQTLSDSSSFIPYLSAPVASPVKKFAEVASRAQIMPPRPINKDVFYHGHKETLFPAIFGKIGGPH